MKCTNFTYEWADKVILLVEDEPVCRLFFTSALRNTEVKVLLAFNGEQAVRMVEEHPKIDVVLMDIKLPIMDGIEATRQIKKIRPELPIIVQTAYALNNECLRALEAGGEDYLTKPIDIELLHEKIDKVFMSI